MKPDNPMAALVFMEKYKVSLDYFDDVWQATYERRPECYRPKYDDITFSGDDIATALQGIHEEMVVEGVIE